MYRWAGLNQEIWPCALKHIMHIRSMSNVYKFNVIHKCKRNGCIALKKILTKLSIAKILHGKPCFFWKRGCAIWLDYSSIANFKRLCWVRHMTSYKKKNKHVLPTPKCEVYVDVSRLRRVITEWPFRIPGYELQCRVTYFAIQIWIINQCSFASECFSER